ncbi:glycoside hydrolase family protein [Zobellia galactanivorans]|uniref:glycoside hydrolase family protein n=1 Tax=Zobellia galactanivorans (strain DSM 12802 / CCUG 47099 / CIP 106680 / NCIMB 13871 / Dsij) TaxID=63186 RepID=UPI0026E2476C|nr:glycoside hydrolase family protein [Zobellia galactanivorans]MDO6809671.1 glycoside hydrolase family protein [Zobellia galactanivorans]
MKLKVAFFILWMFATTPLLAQALNIGAMVQPVPFDYKMESSDYQIWGASVVKGTDGKYHMYYSRWPQCLGHFAWVTDSEIAYAVSDSPEGPYTFVNVALPRRAITYWDGTTTHNPTILLKDNKYYLYYMGSTSNHVAVQPTSMQNKDWWIYRNNQRIGVAVSDNPVGPWKRLDKPIIDVGSDPRAPDALMTSNPATTITPDGKVLLIYKGVGKSKTHEDIDMGKIQGQTDYKGEKVRFMVAFADNPLGPFKKEAQTIFELKGAEDVKMIAEDPYIWFQDDMYYAAVRDVEGLYTGDVGAIALIESKDGLCWKAAKHPLILGSSFKWVNGENSEGKLERPQLLIENGVPTYLFGAYGIEDNGVKRGRCWNVQVPLKSK